MAQSGNQFKKSVISPLAVLTFGLLSAELILRLVAPNLEQDIFITLEVKESPYDYKKGIGYEPRPHATVEWQDRRGGGRLSEKLNSEGFRGPEYKVLKPKEVFRILVIGDSVVFGYRLSFQQSWPHILEKKMNDYAARLSSNTKFEVINMGVEGYVSRQAFLRVKEKGLKYQPDLLLVLVGWNDLVLSSLQAWDEDFDYAKMTKIDVDQKFETAKIAGFAGIRIFLYRNFYIARLLRKAKNALKNIIHQRILISQRQRDSGIEFNEPALKNYLSNIEKIYDSCRSQDVKMGFIIWPSILTPNLVNDVDVQKRLLLIYSIFSLSAHELWLWYERYVKSERDYLLGHQEIISFDAANYFSQFGKKERLNLFMDLAHLSPSGNDLLAQFIFESILKEKMLGPLRK